MKKKIYFLSALLMLSITTAAAQTVDGIYAWQDGKGTSYKLSDNATFTFDSEDKVVAKIGDETQRTFDISTSVATVNYGTYVAIPAVTLNDKGYATFSFKKDVTVATENVTANTLKQEANSYNLTSTPITGNNIPAGNGVLLYGTQGTTVDFYFLETAPAELSDNALKPTTLSDGSLASKGAWVYALKGDKFKQFIGTEFTANRAYLSFDSDPFQASSVKEFVIDLDGEATIISSLSSSANTPLDGKYFIDGRIVIVRGGNQYDLNGILMR